MEAHIEELEENLKIALEALIKIRDVPLIDEHKVSHYALQQIKECEG